MRILPIINKFSFKGYHGLSEFEDGIKNEKHYFLNHTTNFFRYPMTDEFVVSKIKEECKDKPVKIVSAGCSYGEEAYSYSMLLDDMESDVQIDAFDLSPSAIEEAKKGKCMAKDEEAYLLFNKPDDKLSDYEKTCREVFNKHFNHTLNDNYTYIFEKKDGHFKNCKFEKGDVTKIAKKYPPNSVDVVLCRFVLYHIEDIDNGDEEATIKQLKQFYKILKPNGLLVLADSERYPFQEEIFCEAGFELEDYRYPNVYKKVTGYF